ncbi:TetR/AcrR family transcriptional regulator [Celeribacter sp.]|uniref:TetR/AcrR family transcriptional regulator n=1 Tax=Celeribacter sp. TaxID=1890673 RepID=UPI003A8D797D
MIDNKADPKPEGRVARRQRRNRTALIAAARDIMAEKGVDAATMLEIAEHADVGAGTVYNYFKSKDELAIAVLESLMHELGRRIEMVTDTFDDPAQVYAFGIRTVLDTATTDPRWEQMLHRAEVIADAMYRTIGPFAIRDLKNAVAAGRFRESDPAMIWRLTTHTIIGASLAVTGGELPSDSKVQIIARLLCMAGSDGEDAEELAARPLPELPPAPSE